ncbi:lysophospholipid acyltransferase family protein [Mangrovicoccus algicola]|uniref:1-acyl-sn-glycerol-3-phosphate acyltransferase n=1 Tax=Mangrovicoccus algicola TaxID=2771008 RepID=A0A8J6YUP2_9RHOB|nr:lysophospholipid acyltransferase family protein [Mangrovicoccus algicola]MBE3638087.1 1-acyl-sn-glycerol-3-phosphate acyltransferase [Mangrovicoccus algicola]
MAHAWRWIRSLLFILQMYLVMALMGLAFAPWALVDRQGASAGIRTYCRWVRFSARWMVGLRSEIRGPVPEGGVLIASKHQSFLDIILLCSVLRQPRFIMKRELIRAPVLGWFALRIGCVPVDRGRRGAAISKMLKDVAEGSTRPGQLIIYPQGTRVAPGAVVPYKIGSGALYRQMDQTCVPAATNVGLFWPRAGILRKPGLAVVEFLDPIPPGLETEAFMALLQSRVETASDALMAEAGFAKEE